MCVHACVCVHVRVHEKETETPSMQPSCVFHCRFTSVLKGTPADDSRLPKNTENISICRLHGVMLSIFKQKLLEALNGP